MSVAADAAVADGTAPSLLLEHRPWWRGRTLWVALIVAAMIVVYELWGFDANQAVRFPWPAELEWNSLVGYLDRFSVWLSDQRNAPDPSVVFSLFNGFATFLDDLVDWLTRLLLWMTWVGSLPPGRWSSCGSAACAQRRSRSGRSRPSRPWASGSRACRRWR